MGRDKVENSKGSKKREHTRANAQVLRCAFVSGKCSGCSAVQKQCAEPLGQLHCHRSRSCLTSSITWGSKAPGPSYLCRWYQTPRKRHSWHTISFPFFLSFFDFFFFRPPSLSDKDEDVPSSSPELMFSLFDDFLKLYSHVSGESINI